MRTLLPTLNLTVVDARLETLLESASKNQAAYADFLLAVINTEVDARRQRYLKTRLQTGASAVTENVRPIRFRVPPSIDERQMRELRTLRFAHDASNVIPPGPPGVGKTHLAVALAEAAIPSGQAAYFMTAHFSARYERGSILLTSNKRYGEGGFDLRRPDYRNGDSRPSAPSFDRGQHSRRKLLAEGPPQGRADSVTGAARAGFPGYRPERSQWRKHSL